MPTASVLSLPNNLIQLAYYIGYQLRFALVGIAAVFGGVFTKIVRDCAINCTMLCWASLYLSEMGVLWRGVIGLQQAVIIGLVGKLLYVAVHTSLMFQHTIHTATGFFRQVFSSRSNIDTQTL